MYLLAQSSSTTDLDQARDDWFVDGLVAVGVCSDITLRRSASPSINSGSPYDHFPKNAKLMNFFSKASECLNILLRVFVNLTHGDSNWAQSLIANEFAVGLIVRLISSSSSPEDEEYHDISQQSAASSSSSPHHQQQHAWDRQCLALGLLTNLVQSIPRFKNVLRRTSMSPHNNYTVVIYIADRNQRVIAQVHVLKASMCKEMSMSFWFSPDWCT